MKKDNNALKRLLKYTDVKDLHGYFKQGDNYILCNSISVIKFDSNNIDFVDDIKQSQSIHYSYDKFNNMFNDIKKAIQDNNNTIEINIQDLKMWKKHADKNKPFIFKVGDKYAGVNAAYLLDFALLTRQDKNNAVTIQANNNKTPLYIAGNDVSAVLCPIGLKQDYSENDYNSFIDSLADCYTKEKTIQEEKHAKKANKAAGIIPTLQPNKNYSGFTMSFYGVDYFILSDAKRITKSIITEFIKAYCKRNNFSDTVLNDMLNSKMQLDNIKARIEKATFILYTNADNSAFTYIDIKTKYAFNGCMYFECDNKLVLIGCVLPTSTETKEETPKNATIQDNAADIVKDDTCTNTDTAATTDKANNDSVTATQDIKASETIQADARQDTRQTETTQDKPHKTSKKAMCLFIVTDKPQPVKLPHLKPLNNIPMYVERFKTDFKPLKNNKGYNTRVKELKPLKKAYNDFVSTVSMSCDKCAIGGGSVAVNTS